MQTADRWAATATETALASPSDWDSRIYEKRTRPGPILLTRPLGAIVSAYGHVSASLTFVALLVGRALHFSFGSCCLDVEAGVAQAVPSFLLLSNL
jgi:hypothetical protein